MKKKQKTLKKLGIVLTIIVIFLIIINVIPPKKNIENNPFMIGKGELPKIVAHRGGAINNPENTMLAFREAITTIGVDMIESDLYMTKDGYLVYNHDAYIDETCNINGDISLKELEKLCETEENRHYIKDMTLEQLQQYNFGYYFEDEDGNRPYKEIDNWREIGLQIITAEQLLDEFYEAYPNVIFILEIKNKGEQAKEASRMLNNILMRYPNVKERVIIGSFHEEALKEVRTKDTDYYRGASMSGAAKFIFTQYLGVNLFDNGDFVCLQISMNRKIGTFKLPLDKETLVNRAHRRNIAVQYWTINKEEDMRKVIELGCDSIITDNPRLLKEVLEEYR